MKIRRTLSGLLAAAVLMSSGCMQKQEIVLDGGSTAEESSAPTSAGSTAEESAAAADTASDPLSELKRDADFRQIPETAASDLEWEEMYYGDELIGIKVTGYKGSDPDVHIPEEINGATVNSVDIQNGGVMETLVIPGSVLNISNDSFADDGSASPRLREIFVSPENSSFCSIDGVVYRLNRDNVENNGYISSVYNGTLSVVLVPEAREKEITFPDNVTNVKAYAFRNSHVDSVVLPDTVTAIERQAFEYSRNRSIEFRGDLESIPTNAYYSCAAEQIIFDGSIGTIEDGAFSQAADLKSMIIPEGTSDIGAQAFLECTSLESVVIPGSVSSIGEYAFEHCAALTDIMFSDGLKSIGDYAFDRCNSIAHVDLPSTLESIGEWAFSETRITELTLPDSLTFLNERAISYDEPMTVYYRGVAFSLIPGKRIPSDLLDRINSRSSTANVDCHIRRVGDVLVWDEYPGTQKYYLRWDRSEEECLYNNSVNILYRIQDTGKTDWHADVALSLYAVRSDDTEDYAGAFTYRYDHNQYSWRDAQSAGLTTQGQYHISRVYTRLMWDEYPGASFYSIRGNGIQLDCMGSDSDELMDKMSENGGFQYGSTYTFDLYAYDGDDYSDIYMDTFSFEFSYTPSL